MPWESNSNIEDYIDLKNISVTRDVTKYSNAHTHKYKTTSKQIAHYNIQFNNRDYVYHFNTY